MAVSLKENYCISIYQSINNISLSKGHLKKITADPKRFSLKVFSSVSSKFVVVANQGCQMVYFQTKITNLGKCCRVLQ
jgi:hypothetical protein